MKNASRKTEVASATLGTKRACPHCGTKFYDFNKQELSCPKCKEKLDVNKLNQPVKPVEVKKPKAEKIGEDPLVATEEIATEEPIESVEELGEDDEEVVEDLDVEEKEDGDY